MGKLFNRVIGILLIVAAISGLAFSGFGLYLTWSYKNEASSRLVESLDLLVGALDSTSQGLVVIEQSFGTLMVSVSSVQDTLETSVDTIGSTGPLLDSLTTMLDQDLPNTIGAVQTSLDTASESAKIIDAVLQAISLGTYQPEVPLSASLLQISSSLDKLPASFATMEKSLTDTSNQSEIIQADLSTVAATISDIEKNLADYETILQQNKDALKSIRKQINGIKTSIPRAVNATVWALTVFLAWMGIAQLGLLTQGWDLIRRNPFAAAPDPAIETEIAPEAFSETQDIPEETSEEGEPPADEA